MGPKLPGEPHECMLSASFRGCRPEKRLRLEIWTPLHYCHPYRCTGGCLLSGIASGYPTENREPAHRGTPIGD